MPPVRRNAVDRARFNKAADLPCEFRLRDFEMAMQDTCDFVYEASTGLALRSMPWLDDRLRPALMSDLLSEMLTASVS